ncbi:MAG: flagellar basal body-associated FliL family protein [Bdellovibrionales bacterium]|nr:flagellar basal body-associated FliL family protein [Bdellovibrionales bacterium]
MADDNSEDQQPATPPSTSPGEESTAPVPGESSTENIGNDSEAVEDEASSGEGVTPRPRLAEDLDEILDNIKVEEGEGALDMNEAELAMVDGYIREADPEFAEELDSISADDFKELDITEEQAKAAVSAEEIPSRWRAFFNNLSDQQRFSLILGGSVALLGVLLVALLLGGYLVPKFEVPYLLSMEQVSKVVFPYALDDEEVPLFDEYRSRAYSYPLRATNINLKQEGDRPSYGQFQFFLNLRDKELEPVIKKRESELIDLIQRTLEQITWSDLQTPIGKEKVKKIVRMRVNDHLKGNYVLGVYYKSVLLSR